MNAKTMDMIPAMKTFVLAVQTGTFSAAARALGTTQPTVSRTIAALEKHLSVRLFHRSTRAIMLTDDGRLFHELARRALETLFEAEEGIRQRCQAPAGLIRMGTPQTFGKLLIAPAMPRFLALHPGIDLELCMNEKYVDMIAGGLDLMIRIGELSDQSLIARRIGVSRRVTVASSAYLKQRGVPLTPADLAHHDCVVHTRLALHERWRFESGDGPITVKVHGRFRADDAEVVRDAVLAGAGITVAPLWIYSRAIERGQARVILPGFAPRPLPVHAVYASGKFLSGRVRAIIDFLVTALGSHAFLGENLNGAAFGDDGQEVSRSG